METRPIGRLAACVTIPFKPSSRYTLNPNPNAHASSAQKGANSSIQNTVAITCFFLSGFAGLVYEVAWMRKASLIFGSTTFAVSTVLAVFFLGLAGGSYLFGRIAQATTRPLKLYALIEFALGALALVSPYAFDLADNLYGGTLPCFCRPHGVPFRFAFYSGFTRRASPYNTHGRNAPTFLSSICYQRLTNRQFRWCALRGEYARSGVRLCSRRTSYYFRQLVSASRCGLVLP